MRSKKLTVKRLDKIDLSLSVDEKYDLWSAAEEIISHIYDIAGWNSKSMFHTVTRDFSVTCVNDCESLYLSSTISSDRKNKSIKGLYHELFQHITIDFDIILDTCDESSIYPFIFDGSYVRLDESGLVEVRCKIAPGQYNKTSLNIFRKNIRGILAHEMQHAIQHQMHNLNFLEKENSSLQEHMQSPTEVDARVEESLARLPRRVILTDSHLLRAGIDELSDLLREYLERNGVSSKNEAFAFLHSDLMQLHVACLRRKLAVFN